MSTVEITKITESYVYMVKNKKTGHWYIGKQGNIRKVIGYNYFTTSSAKHTIAQWFRKSFARNSDELDNWDIKILFQGKDYEEAEEVLIELMGLHHPENNPFSLNFGNAGEKWSRTGTVTAFDYISNKIVSIPQEEFHARKEVGEVIYVTGHPEIKAKYEATCIENFGVPHPIQSPEIQAKYQATSLKKYGVPNPTQSLEVQERMKQTCMEIYGVEYASQSHEFQEKRKQTCIDVYGVEHVSQSPEVREKIMTTCMENYGVPYSMMDEGVKAKARATNEERLGVPYPMQSEEVRAKSRETCMKNLGVENPMQSEEVRAKARKTCMEIYGVENVSQSPEVREKVMNTCMENYGVPHSIMDEGVKAKVRATNEERLGVPYPMQSEEVQLKHRETCMKNLGVETPMQSEEVRAKARKTCMENYGVEYALQSPEVQEKYKQTTLQNFGVEYSFQSPEVRAKSEQTMIEKYGVKNIGLLMGIPVVAFISHSEGIHVIGSFCSYSFASKFSMIVMPNIQASVTDPNRHAGIYDLSINSFVKLKLGATKLPSEAHPNLYRVKWMRLEDFQQTHPTVTLPSMEPPANDSQYIAPELSANL